MLVTLPLGVLQKGSVRFIPELPAAKQEAIDTLIMGPALKLIYRFDEPVLPTGLAALYSAVNPPMWWSPSFGHDERRNGHDRFHHRATGRASFTPKAKKPRSNTASRRSRANWGSKLPRPQAAVMVNWIDDPFAFGGYSVAPPGAVRARASARAADRRPALLGGRSDRAESMVINGAWRLRKWAPCRRRNFSVVGQVRRVRYSHIEMQEEG